jgi:hypothetical protein
LTEKGVWNLEGLEAEFKELIFSDALIELSGFELDESDQLVVGDEPAAIERGPLSPESGAQAVARVGDVFLLGRHRLICGDASDDEAIKTLIRSNTARMVLTDEPFNVPVGGNVTGGEHREFLVASGEMSAERFLQFNQSWMTAIVPYVVDDGMVMTFIDWRGLPTGLC